MFTFNIIVILSDRCVCLHTGCPLLSELGVHKAQAWNCRAYELDLARNKSTLKMKSSLQVVNAPHRQIRAADRNAELCPMMSQITNRADIWLKTNKHAPTWWMAAWSLSNLLESHLRSSPLFSELSVANLSSQRHLPAAPLHRAWPFPFYKLLVLTCWISSWLMSPTTLVVSHQTVPVCSYSPTAEVMSNIVFLKWSPFVCVRGMIFVLKCLTVRNSQPYPSLKSNKKIDDLDW